MVAQFGSRGEDYILENSMYEDLIEATVLEEYNKFTNTDKKELQVLYERNFLRNYYDEELRDYIYTDDELAYEITGRFKAWLDDNFSIEDMLNESEEEEDWDEDEDEDEESETDEDDENAK